MLVCMSYMFDTMLCVCMYELYTIYYTMLRVMYVCMCNSVDEMLINCPVICIDFMQRLKLLATAIRNVLERVIENEMLHGNHFKSNYARLPDIHT